MKRMTIMAVLAAGVALGLLADVAEETEVATGRCGTRNGLANKTSKATEGGLHKKVQLWEGGPYWATTNIGADEPWEYGYYFWWGDTVGYKRVDGAWVASDCVMTNFPFTAGNVPTCDKNIQVLRREGWITVNNVLAPEHDAAHVHWGGKWRMPTNQELDDLCRYKCDWMWITTNGVNGYVVRGRGSYATNSIFLPAAGFGYVCGTSLSSVRDIGLGGSYWSSVPHSDSKKAYELGFSLNGHSAYSPLFRGYVWSIRPVQGIDK